MSDDPMPVRFRRFFDAGSPVVGTLSGRTFVQPAVNHAPMPDLAPDAPILDGVPLPGFGTIAAQRGAPDCLSFRRKIGLLVPATNTSMEAELWRLVASNPDLAGIGIHTVPVPTPRPTFRTNAEVEAYRRDFLAGLGVAAHQALLADPEYIILGMSLEHFVHGLAAIEADLAGVVGSVGIGWALWHEAVDHALRRVGARRIALLTPFEATGNRNAARMFGDLGYEVVATFGFCCGHAGDIAHIPDWAKEKAVTEVLAAPDRPIDAIVQCGTNMALSHLVDRLEARLDLPLLGVNATLLWFALRENGHPAPVTGAGRLLRDH